MQMPKTIQIKNGEKVSPTFSAQEYANRQGKLRAYLAQNNIDAAVFTSYHNINYYSDFLYCSFGRQYALVVTQDSAVTTAPTSMAVSHGAVPSALKISSTPTGSATTTSSRSSRPCPRPGASVLSSTT